MLNKILIGVILSLLLAASFLYYNNKKLLTDQQVLKDTQTLLVNTNKQNAEDLETIKRDAAEREKLFATISKDKEIVYVKTTKFVKEIVDKPLPPEYSCEISPDVITALNLVLKMDLENE